MTTRGRFLVSMTAVLVVMVINPVPAPGQEGRGGGSPDPARSVPRRPDGKPDLTGRWNGSAGQIAHTNILEEHPGGFGINVYTAVDDDIAEADDARGGGSRLQR